jgi:hypothetical protein
LFKTIDDARVLIADLSRMVAEAVGAPYTGPGYCDIEILDGFGGAFDRHVPLPEKIRLHFGCLHRCGAIECRCPADWRFELGVPYYRDYVCASMFDIQRHEDGRISFRLHGRRPRPGGEAPPHITHSITVQAPIDDDETTIITIHQIYRMVTLTGVVASKLYALLDWIVDNPPPDIAPVIVTTFGSLDGEGKFLIGSGDLYFEHVRFVDEEGEQIPNRVWSAGGAVWNPPDVNQSIEAWRGRGLMD